MWPAGRRLLIPALELAANVYALGRGWGGGAPEGSDSQETARFLVSWNDWGRHSWKFPNSTYRFKYKEKPSFYLVLSYY